MGKKLIIFLFLLLICFNTRAETTIVQLFEVALNNDPTYLKILEQTLSKIDDVEISRSNLLPSIDLLLRPQQNKINASGAVVAGDLLSTYASATSFSSLLHLNQSIFNFSKLANLETAKIELKQAHATLNATLQDLMYRVAAAYLRILSNKEYLAFYAYNKKVIGTQLKNANHLYKQGSGNVNDVYSAQAAFSAAEARYIQAQVALTMSEEALTSITGEEIAEIPTLQNDLPLPAPHPSVLNPWLNKAKTCNWSIKANQYALQAARGLIKQSSANHLPTVDLNIDYGQADFTIHKTQLEGILVPPGYSSISNNVIALNFRLPLFKGGLVVAQTKKAQHNFNVAAAQLELVRRKIIYNTKESFLTLLADIEKINSEKISIKSTKNSLKDTREQYKLGSKTILDLLNAEEKLIQLKAQYVASRYSYITNFLKLKKETGTLALTDLAQLDSWVMGPQRKQ